MNPQAVFDRVAKIIGGGPTAGDRVGLFRGAGGIAGVKAAWSVPPDSGTLGQDGIFAVVFAGSSNLTLGDSGDLTFYKHDVRIQLLLSMARSDIAKAHALLTPFVPLFFTTFHQGNTLLAGTANAGALIRRVVYPIDTTPLYADRLALEFEMEASEEEAVVYA